MTTAHVFQHNFTGVQLFVYHVYDEAEARKNLAKSVSDYSNWFYIGTKTVIN